MSFIFRDSEVVDFLKMKRYAGDPRSSLQRAGGHEPS